MGRLSFYLSSVWLLGAVCGLSACQAVAASGAEPSFEYSVKAAYLYNFLKFVSWPEPPEGEAGPIGLCVLGEDPFGTAIENLAERSVKGRRVRIARLRRGDDLTPCDLLYVSPSEAGSLDELLPAVVGRGVLTVSDIEGFARAGGMIGFVDNAGRIGFEVNLEAARREGLRPSANLLELARIVKTRKR